MAAAAKNDTKTEAKTDETPDAAPLGGEDALRKNDMMAHLLDSLNEGKDIGHYGRLVFAMVARHFMEPDALAAQMGKDKDFSEGEARALIAQVQGKDYNPPRREKILDYQSQQEFPIIPNPDDPDAGNVYRDLQFPDHVYEHIADYYEHKQEAAS